MQGIIRSHGSSIIEQQIQPNSVKMVVMHKDQESHSQSKTNVFMRFITISSLIYRTMQLKDHEE